MKSNPGKALQGLAKGATIEFLITHCAYSSQKRASERKETAPVTSEGRLITVKKPVASATVFLLCDFSHSANSCMPTQSKVKLRETSDSNSARFV
jgi:hypothetical protein